ncbi:RDD family protein [Bacillus alkalicellulosilyticus]|uniref:RDD family protein n=1 Tax=Alkalihalobacterium alkalicellulosilyticum TaxID=1912214 RepID=UPI00099694CC|nr:RDD family protein [Bacillus alkalicellulosilyticus]
MNQQHIEVKTPEYVSLQFQPAGLGSRAVAYILDLVVLTLLNILVLFILYLVNMDNPLFYDWGNFTIAVTIIVLFLINWGYFFLLEYITGGRTFGKRLIGLRIIQENGHSITLLSSFIRNLIRIIDNIFYLGMILIFLHPKHKRLGDIVAGTIVVHERKKKSKKMSTVDKEIEKRSLSKETISFEETSIQALQMKEWKLIKAYSERLGQIPSVEREQVTQQIADVIFPKLGLGKEGKTLEELENTLLVIYLYLKEEWEFEL